MSINQRFRDLITALNISESVFSKKLGYANSSSINQITGARESKPGSAVLQKVVEVFNVNPEWLLTGVGEMFRVPGFAEKSTSSFNANAIPHIMMVPLVNQYAYAGYTQGYNDDEYIGELPEFPFPVEDKSFKGKYMAFEVRGDSMDNTTEEAYESGEVVLGREVLRHHWYNKLHINKWDFVIVHKTEGILLKRITNHDVDNGKLVLHSLNEDYEDQEVNLDDVVQIFNVIKSAKNRSR